MPYLIIRNKEWKLCYKIYSTFPVDFWVRLKENEIKKY